MVIQVIDLFIHYCSRSFNFNSYKNANLANAEMFVLKAKSFYVSPAVSHLSDMPFCKPSCFLRSIQRCNKRQMERYPETREDLEDLYQNEPAKRENTRQKIDAIDAQIRELTIRAYKLQNCLDNGCDDCFPGSGIPFE